MLDSTETAVLQLSGGKDSVALLHMARPHLDRITVFFGDTGAVYPHVAEYVRETCGKLGVRLEVIRPPLDVLAYTAINGLPADIVPVETAAMMAPHMREKPKQLLQSYMACCGAMIFAPMAKAIKESGTTIVLRGSKKSDARVGVADRFVEDGIEYRSPLWNMTDADVFAYLKRQGIALPRHYADVPDSLDCWACTGHMAHHGAAKLKWTRENYPDLYPVVVERVRRVRAVLATEVMRIAPAFNEAEIA